MQIRYHILFFILITFFFNAKAQKASISGVYINGRCIDELDILVDNNTGHPPVGMDVRITIKTKGGTTVYSQVDFIKFT